MGPATRAPRSSAPTRPRSADRVSSRGRMIGLLTNHGSQFTSPRFTELLIGVGVTASMDGRGRWLDNVLIERPWRALTYGCVLLDAFETGTEARARIGKRMIDDNADRSHSALGGRTLEEAHAGQRRHRFGGATEPRTKSVRAPYLSGKHRPPHITRRGGCLAGRRANHRHRQFWTSATSTTGVEAARHDRASRRMGGTIRIRAPMPGRAAAGNSPASPDRVAWDDAAPLPIALAGQSSWSVEHWAWNRAVAQAKTASSISSLAWSFCSSTYCSWTNCMVSLAKVSSPWRCGPTLRLASSSAIRMAT